MKREIKFRIFDKNISTLSEAMNGKKPSGKMLYNMDYIINSDYFKNSIKGEYPLMQFTGLKDKNGVEIYEGDIVEDLNSRKVVEWEFSASCSCCNEASGYLWSEDESKYLEVIGNIYENPELLNN